MNIEELNSETAIPNVEMGHLLALASLIGVLVACVLAILAWWGSRRTAPKRAATSYTGLSFCIVFLLGFVLYCVGTLPYIEAGDGVHFISLWSTAPIAIIHSIGMFLLQSESGSLHEPYHENWFFVALFSLTHTAAAYLSATVLIRHFGFSLIARLRTLLTARFGGSTEELFIFWGTGEAALQLSSDIRRHETRRHRIVFVYDKPADDNDPGNNTHNFFSLLKMQPEEVVHFKALRCYLCQPSQALADFTQAMGKHETIPLLRIELEMRDLARLIGKTTGTVHLLFLGEDEAANLRCLTLLQHDEQLVAHARRGLPVKLYARAEDNRISRALNDSIREPNIDVQLIDASAHSIYFMKDRPEYHPIRYVELDTDRNPGTVTSAFHSMVIGFGYTGQDALRFLYEYGAFVDSRSTVDEDFNGLTAKGEPARVFRSPFRCDLVDPLIESKAEAFFADYPAMRPTGPVEIRTHACATDSAAFTRLLNEQALALNYVVIAAGSDSLNLDIAIQVFSRLRQVRRDFRRLTLFVQCTSAERARHFRSVIDYYNQDQETLVLFGSNEMIYTYPHIIYNEYELRSRLYNESYCRVNRSPENQWKARREKLVKKGTLDALASLRRKEWEDCQDAFHAATKAYLYEQACPKVRPAEELVRLLCGDGTECNFRRCEPYPTTDEVNAPHVEVPVCVMDHDTTRAGRVLTEAEDLFLLNLARLEHLRWNASHEALGYIPLQEYLARYGDDFRDEPYETRHTCSETRRCHNCLVGWEDLDRESLNAWQEIIDHDGYRWLPDYKLADFGVVANALYHSFSTQK